jgi:protein-L-isoaspartate(D-aspartate) O-methyltransferase
MIEQRAMMIMTLRGLGIRDTAVLSAVESTPRELFIPRALKKHAYENVSLPIAHGQTISQPFVVASMTSALAMTGKERVLEIGTGSGYQAAVLSHLCRRVYTIERLRPLLVEADRRIQKLKITNYTSKFADGSKGWPEAAPFDRIIVTCASPSRPDALLAQLKEEGIMIVPVDHAGEQNSGQNSQLMMKYTKDADGQIHEEALFDVRFVPLISDSDQG